MSTQLSNAWPSSPKPSNIKSASTRPSPRRALLALPVAALLAVAGCSFGGDDDNTASTVTATVTAPAQTGTPAADQDDFDPANCSTDRSGQDIGGDVYVRSGQTCVLSDLAVSGDVDVLGDGRLELRNVRVAEDVEAEGHAYVSVTGGEVSGSIELEHGGEAVVENVRIGGSLESEENSGPQHFQGNTIGDDLECEDNAQAPTGGGNQVSGEREGQCSGL